MEKVIKAEKGRDFFEKLFFADQLQEEKTPQEIWGIPEEKIDKIYQFACDLYDEKRDEDASDVFLLLTTLRPDGLAFWKGLAFSSQRKSDFAAALIAYEYALALDPTHAELYPYYLRTLCELDRKEQALIVLKELMDRDFDDSAATLRIIRTQAEAVVT